MIVTVLRLLLTGILGLIETGSSTQLSVGMLISLAAAFAMMGLRPYENDNDNSLSVLSYVQISLVMMCGLVLKSQDLVESESSFDKENLGYVLIAVNVLLLVSAVVLGVVQFIRQGEDDYESSSVFALAKRGVNSVGSRGKKSLENEQDEEIELGDIYSGGGSGSFDGVNPVQKIAKKLKKKGGLHINSHHPAPKEPERLTDEDIARMGPPPTPTVFTSYVGEEEDDRL